MNVRMKKQGKTIFLDLLSIIVGGCIWAVGLNVFTVPNKIAPGGATGVATVLNYFTSLPVGTLIILINIPLFIAAFFLVGKIFILKTAAAIVITGVILDISALFLPTFTEDKLLAAIFGGVLSGVGLGIIYIRGIATGGSDLLARLIDSKVPFFSYTQTILIIDAAVVIFAAVAFRDWKSVLYAAITVFLTSIFSEKLLSGLTSAKIVYIVTETPEIISPLVLGKMKRGATLIPAKGCYTEKDTNILMVTVKNYELPALKKIIKEKDKNAFITVGDASEIIGNGFPTKEG